MYNSKYFIDAAGLSYFWKKAKEYIDGQINNNKPSLATPEKDGLMSKEDKAKLDDLGNLTFDADTVLFKNNLIITADVGVHEIDQSVGYKELQTTGKSVRQVFDILFAEEKNPTITQPSINITSTSMKSYEVGSRVTPNYSISFDPGKYSYGPDTNVTVTSTTVTDTNSGSKTELSGNFDEFQIQDETNYSITAKVIHTQGEIPVTNLGNPYEEGRILANDSSPITKNLGNITGYRNTFYGTLDNKLTEINSDTIRNLQGKSNKKLNNGNTFNINIPIGALRVVIAYPASLRDVTSVLDVNAFNTPIQSEFLKNKTTVNVKGANDYQEIEYKVFYMDYAAPNDTVNTYKITI